MTGVDVLIVGAGVTGLASALHLARDGRSVCVLDAHPRPGMQTSTHNSGVIHAGLYYPAGSLKARLCLEGRDRLYAFCETHGVPHRRTGKLVVIDDQTREHELVAIAERARGNGARADILGKTDISALEPSVDAAIALWSPDTGIVDASSLVRTLAAQAEQAGAAMLPSTSPQEVELTSNGFAVHTGRETIAAQVLVNAAGLFADDVSRLCGGEPFRIWACRGDYAVLTRRAAARFTRPIYPLPEPSGHGLGVHITPTPGGDVTLGPTSRYQDSKTDYESDRPTLDFFLDAARRLVPTLSRDDVREGPSGIRAKLHPPHEHFADFLVRPDTQQPRLVHAAGIDSPGLTSCLAIGRLVSGIVGERL